MINVVTINHSLVWKEEKVLRLITKNSLECVKTVLRVLPNVQSIGVVRLGESDGLTNQLKDGLITVVELNPHELTEEELTVISHLGIQLPLLDKGGNEIPVKRLNLDSDDIRILKKL